MPLGLFPEMEYEEKDTLLASGDLLLLYSDGLIEAHDAAGSMFGFQRVWERLDQLNDERDLIENLLSGLSAFTGEGWEQEDDVTLVTLEHDNGPEDEREKILDEFNLPSQPGNEREAMRRVASVIGDLGFDSERIERIKTAVAEGTMNAMEHGNKYREDQPASVKVCLTKAELVVQITDYGGESEIPEVEDPDLDAKLAGLQSPRGWGLFLIRSMVDELRTHSDNVHHTIELVFKR
jgi:anti-sigma regulatory factor (Ser/Thr protein kinase)